MRVYISSSYNIIVRLQSLCKGISIGAGGDPSFLVDAAGTFFCREARPCSFRMESIAISHANLANKTAPQWLCNYSSRCSFISSVCARVRELHLCWPAQATIQYCLVSPGMNTKGTARRSHPHCQRHVQNDVFNALKIY